VNGPDPQPTENAAARRDVHRAEATVTHHLADAAQPETDTNAAPANFSTTPAASASQRTSATPAEPRNAAALLAAFTLVAMIVLAVAWEWWLAPLRPGGSLLVLKALPLLSALPGVWRRRLYTLQWASMLILLYFAEGIVRGWSDHGLSARLGWLQTGLAVIFFVSALAYVGPFKRAAKQAAKQPAKRAAAETDSESAPPA